MLEQLAQFEKVLLSWSSEDRVIERAAMLRGHEEIGAEELGLPRG